MSLLLFPFKQKLVGAPSTFLLTGVAVTKDLILELLILSKSTFFSAKSINPSLEYKLFLKKISLTLSP